MSCCFSQFAVIIVAIQFFTRTLPWIYQNIVGPMILGPKLKLREYGEWARKFFIAAMSYQNGTSCSIYNNKVYSCINKKTYHIS